MMKPLNHGLYVVIVTPFTDTGRIDQEGLRTNIEWYLELGASGIICTGSTGSFDALSHDEMKEVMRIASEQVSGRTTALAGTAATTTEKAVDLSKFAESVGMNGVMVVPPYYCIPTVEELYEHYKAIAKSISIPVMIYNNPRRTGVDMSPQWLVKIAGEIDNISYVKDSSGDPRRVHQIIALEHGKLIVFTGNDDLCLYALVAGAKGWVAAPANIVPELALSLVRAVEQGDIDKAKGLFYRLLPLLGFIGRTGKLVQVCKAGLEMRGRCGGSLRRPRLPLTREEETELRGILEELEVL
jgi:4-hydroxy-tetrahydrodipicolinate synthase